MLGGRPVSRIDCSVFSKFWRKMVFSANSLASLAFCFLIFSNCNEMDSRLLAIVIATEL